MLAFDRRSFLNVALASCVVVIVLIGSTAAAQEAKPVPVGAPTAAAEPRDRGDASPDRPEAKSSEAERIAAIENLLKADRERLASLNEELERLHEQFTQASDEFMRLDARVSDDEKAQVSPELKREWKQSRDRFDLVIARRRAVQQQIETLLEKIDLEEETLERLTSADPSASEAAGTDRHDDGDDASVSQPSKNEVLPEDKPPSGGLLADLFPQFAAPSPETAESDSSQEAVEPVEAEEIDEEIVVDERLAHAREEYAKKKALLRSTEAELETLTRAEDLIERDIASTRQLLDTDRRELEAAQEELATVSEELEQRTAAGASPSELDELRGRRESAESRVAAARQAIEGHTARLVELQSQLEQVQVAERSAIDEVETARSEAETAANWVGFYESPVAPHRIARWFADHGLNVLLIIVLMIALWWLSRIVARRIVSQLALRSRRGTASEREMRAETLKRVFQSTAGVAIIAVGGLALLNESGFDVTVLLGGAAVIGAAIAFGAQNLIKDYFLGFMILVENQYSVGNVIRLGEITGTVEDITLRMTVLRDLEGVVHFIPHSQVTTVSNLTHGWSQVVCDVGIGYGEDVDQVMELLLDVTRELRDDATFGPLLLGEAEMLGVERLADSAIVIRFIVKTRPLKQWMVKRELLRRIKKAFDKRGIEIPFPQRTLHIPGLDAFAPAHEREPVDTRGLQNPPL